VLNILSNTKKSSINCRADKYKTASQHKLKGFVGRALGIEAVSFFLGRNHASEKRFSGYDRRQAGTPRK